jgi:hypothetical protein
VKPDQKRDWRPTSFRRLNGASEIAPNDWTLFDGAGKPVARIYRYAFGPNAGRWSWFVLVAPDGTPCNGGTGSAATASEARDACQARIPIKLFERRVIKQHEFADRAKSRQMTGSRPGGL